MPEGAVGWQPGKFGGTMMLSQESANYDPHIFIGTNEPLLWAPAAFDFTQPAHGNVLKGYEANENDTEFTFYMRPGMKWSDGMPVTTEDVRFAVEDVLKNEEIYPVFPTRYRSLFSVEGTPCELTVIDDYTFKLTFDQPYGSFPAHLAISDWVQYNDLLKPAHYLKQFHIDYTPLEELLPLMEAESIAEDEWFNLFNTKQMTHLSQICNPQKMDHPVLTPWYMTSHDAGVYMWERNPYYFKVDTEGNQLPYIDYLRSDLISERETLMLRALTGEFDYPGERASLKKLPLMREQEDAGLINIYMARMHRLPYSARLNYTYPDPVWREVTGDLRFRQALSLAINRQEILDIFYFGQFAQLPTELNDAEYNVDKANQLLDDMGMDEKDAEGFRLGPDGKRFEIRFDVVESDEDLLPITELIAEYWSKVGVYTTASAIDSALYGPRDNANEVMATAQWGHHDIWRGYGNTDYNSAHYSLLWTQWYNTDGETGEEPPEEIKEIWENHKLVVTSTIGSAEAEAAFDAIMDNIKENVWMFVPVEHSYYPTFFTKRMRNVPTGISDVLGIVTMHSMEQWYIEE